MYLRGGSGSASSAVTLGQVTVDLLVLVPVPLYIFCSEIYVHLGYNQRQTFGSQLCRLTCLSASERAFHSSAMS